MAARAGVIDTEAAAGFSAVRAGFVSGAGGIDTVTEARFAGAVTVSAVRAAGFPGAVAGEGRAAESGMFFPAATGCGAGRLRAHLITNRDIIGIFFGVLQELFPLVGGIGSGGYPYGSGGQVGVTLPGERRQRVGRPGAGQRVGKAGRRVC